MNKKIVILPFTYKEFEIIARDDDIEMLEAISKLKTMNWIERRLTLYRHQIYKNGLMRNIWMMVTI
ncbi:MAG TPA: hypothetical protein CFH84_08085 [Sulfurimonas sp. UBA12504]|nr:MAG TPA: hypothetical protein CFH84_08085 [Sulfurimonas sp. UBA12504]